MLRRSDKNAHQRLWQNTFASGKNTKVWSANHDKPFRPGMDKSALRMAAASFFVSLLLAVYGESAKQKRYSEQPDRRRPNIPKKEKTAAAGTPQKKSSLVFTKELYTN